LNKIIRNFKRNAFELLSVGVGISLARSLRCPTKPVRLVSCSEFVPC
jgi:hypothetical protein